MASVTTRLARRTMAVLLGLTLVCTPLISQQEEYKCHVQSDLVLVNVTVRDKSGNIITNLKPGGFTILEDNKPQKVVSFDIQNIDAVANQDVAQVPPVAGSPPGKAKVFESSLVEITELNARDRKAGVFQLDLPLTSLTGFTLLR